MCLELLLPSKTFIFYSNMQNMLTQSGLGSLSPLIQRQDTTSVELKINLFPEIQLQRNNKQLVYA